MRTERFSRSPPALRLLDLPPGGHDRAGTTDDQSRDIMTGTIKKIVRDRGFGFIRDMEGREYFFHESAVRDTPFTDLTEGATVEFDAELVRLKR